jgi:hypothetical protein
MLIYESRDPKNGVRRGFVVRACCVGDVLDGLMGFC